MGGKRCLKVLQFYDIAPFWLKIQEIFCDIKVIEWLFNPAIERLCILEYVLQTFSECELNSDQK